MGYILLYYKNKTGKEFIIMATKQKNAADVLIIGAGPAGITASIYALRAGLSVIVLDGNLYGGQAAITSQIENYPAIRSISGAIFAQQLYQQAIDLKANIRFEEVTSVDFSQKTKTVVTTKNTYMAKAVIVANGVKRRLLHCSGEKELTGKGVSYCATCDGMFFRNKEVIIVGGGNTALEDALFLSNQCQKVLLVHRKETFTAEKALVDAVMARKNITIMYYSQVTKINGRHKVTSANIYDSHKKETSTIPIDGVFIAIGYAPDNHIVSDFLDTSPEGYLSASEDCHTKIDGVFVAGDTRTKPLRQIVTACSDGAVAAIAASSYISKQY